MWYDDLKIRNVEGKTINFTDWQKQTIDTLDEHKNIKKVWLVNKQRKTGATYFFLLLFLRLRLKNICEDFGFTKKEKYYLDKDYIL